MHEIWSILKDTVAPKYYELTILRSTKGHNNKKSTRIPKFFAKQGLDLLKTWSG